MMERATAATQSAPPPSGERLQAALAKATGALMARLNADGHWAGHLAASALSTATAVTALRLVDRALGSTAHSDLVAGGLRWLADNQNDDGGWGDTVLSKSNISTTALCWAALGPIHPDHAHPETKRRATAWLAKAVRGGDAQDFTDAELARAITRRYGKDRTFAVPILMMCAASGALMKTGWRHVPPLPFELAAVPHQFYGALRLPVVSYALPALIAIGQAIHHHRPTRFLPLRMLRDGLRKRTLGILEAIQPPNGGFLEATPLTSFVTMALAVMGQAEHEVARRGVEFLRASVRPDGSWPIDTNLATWTTTLAIKALAYQRGSLTPEQKLTLREWLMAQQYRTVHPYTHAAPGGWAWTDLPGGVPDADDTPGALLALLSLGAVNGPVLQSGEAGLRWLLGLQNRDGGIPTFCRGWGALPFDCSSPDLTAHCLRAWSAWRPHVNPRLQRELDRAITRATAFLASTQRPDGSWLPLWFGNEHAPDDENPVYGTAQVLLALRELRHRDYKIPNRFDRPAAAFLARFQRPDGAWSGAGPEGPASTEETALSLEALAGTAHIRAVDTGLEWLVARVESGEWTASSPIGFYFAKLWYYEELYPLIWTVGALGKAAALQLPAEHP